MQIVWQELADAKRRKEAARLATNPLLKKERRKARHSLFSAAKSRCRIKGKKRDNLSNSLSIGGEGRSTPNLFSRPKKKRKTALPSTICRKKGGGHFLCGKGRKGSKQSFWRKKKRKDGVISSGRRPWGLFFSLREKKELLH